MKLPKFEGYYNIAEAVEYLSDKGIQVSIPTFRNWGKQYGFLVKKGNGYYVGCEQLDEMIANGFEFEE